VIVEVLKPDSIEEALELLARPNPKTVPMGGGTVLSAPSDEQFAVVDLAKLGLGGIERKGSTLAAGATATLEELLRQKDLPDALEKAIRHEATFTLRQTATLAGTLVSADGRSPLATLALAMDAQLALQPGDEEIAYGEILPLRLRSGQALRSEKLAGRLITRISLPLQVKLSYQYVARSPADLPIVAVAIAQWPSERTRITIGGYGAAPLAAMDGPSAGGAAEAVGNAFSHASDEWATAEYRLSVAKTLTERCLAELEQMN
jgi:CO/xanthine dehydrogenase FAD-binding subunit